jgi:hypothetical protein
MHGTKEEIFKRKVHDDTIKEIRYRFLRGDPCVLLASQFKLSLTFIYAVCKNKVRKNERYGKLVQKRNKREALFRQWLRKFAPEHLEAPIHTWANIKEHPYWWGPIFSSQINFNRVLSRVLNSVDVQFQHGCWTWNGKINHVGTGDLFLSFGRFAAPRLVWMLFRDELAPFDRIGQECGNPLCVRLRHLYKYRLDK